MTQSKKNDDTFTISLDDSYSSTTYNTLTGDTITITGGNYTDSNYTIIGNAADTITFDELNISWPEFNNINPDEVEKMCNEYPALEKVWRNFKSVYDMCKQDYQGKKEAGELDD
jgi:uncharacterized protein YqfB (UPF0267 family)